MMKRTPTLSAGYTLVFLFFALSTSATKTPIIVNATDTLICADRKAAEEDISTNHLSWSEKCSLAWNAGFATLLYKSEYAHNLRKRVYHFLHELDNSTLDETNNVPCIEGIPAPPCVQTVLKAQTDQECCAVYTRVESQLSNATNIAEYEKPLARAILQYSLLPNKSKLILKRNEKLHQTLQQYSAQGHPIAVWCNMSKPLYEAVEPILTKDATYTYVGASPDIGMCPTIAGLRAIKDKIECDAQQPYIFLDAEEKHRNYVQQRDGCVWPTPYNEPCHNACKELIAAYAGYTNTTTS